MSYLKTVRKSAAPFSLRSSSLFFARKPQPYMRLYPDANFEGTELGTIEYDDGTNDDFEDFEVKKEHISRDRLNQNGTSLAKSLHGSSEKVVIFNNRERTSYNTHILRERERFQEPAEVPFSAASAHSLQHHDERELLKLPEPQTHRRVLDSRSCSSYCFLPTLDVILTLFFWFSCSVLLTAINKYLFSTLGFHYPVFVTFLHFSFMSFFLYMVYFCTHGLSDFPSINASDYVKFIIPIAAFSALEIALTNETYQYISLSAITVIKSSAAVHTYLFSICFGLEKFRCSLFCTVVFIILSISCALPGMQDNSLWGIFLLLAAVLVSSLRWVLVHHQLQESKVSVPHLLLFTQPLGSVLLALMAFFLDMDFFSNHLMRELPYSSKLYVIFLISVSIIIAFCLIMAEYRFVCITSSVTLCVAGLGKEVFTIFLATTYFGETVTLRSTAAIACSIVGIALYTYLRTNPSQASVNERLDVIVKEQPV